jgi:S-adenosylmethionine hydrolase
MTLVTLTTDFGRGDYGTGLMRGVVWTIAPQARVLDLSHEIEPHNILQGARLLESSAPYFPAGTIHVMVVDPGVGTARHPIAARLGEQYFVGPDNGLCSLYLRRVEGQGGELAFVHLDRPQFWLPRVSHIFHGRDIFAPAAGYLAAGTALQDLGTVISEVVRL